jgi:hypothetical protein
MTDHPLTRTLETRFGGVLRTGSHDPDGQACALEAASVARGAKWSDEPEIAKLPDLRPINDARWESDAQRTEHLVPVILAFWNWPRWGEKRKRAIFARIVERTIREILPPMLRLQSLDAEADRCETEGSAAAAASAATSAATSTSAYASAYASASASADAASADADAASASYASAASAASAASSAVLIQACRIWAEEAKR